MAIDLKLLERRIDKWLSEETEESIRNWLLEQRQNSPTNESTKRTTHTLNESIKEK